jgi:hypothetical protein
MRKTCKFNNNEKLVSRGACLSGKLSWISCLIAKLRLNELLTLGQSSRLFTLAVAPLDTVVQFQNYNFSYIPCRTTACAALGQV